MPVQVSTDLPEPESYSLDDSVEEEITASWVDTSDNGNYRVQYKESEDTEWLTALANKTTLSAADSTTDWTHGAGTDLSTVSLPSEDGTALRGDTVDTSSNQHMTYNPSGSFSVSGVIQFYIYTNYPDEELNFKIFDSNGNSHSIAINDRVNANDGTLVQIDTSTVSGVDLSSVDRFSWDIDATVTDRFVILDSLVMGDPVSSHATDTLTIPHLKDGKTYDVRVRAETAYTEGSWFSASATTILPDPTNLSLDATTDREIALSWTKNDDNLDGEFVVYRSTDGTTGSQLTSLSPDAESYTDTGLNDGEKYYYTVRRVVDTTGDTTQQSAVTNLPAPSNLSQTVVADYQIDLSWDDNSNNEDNFRIQIDRNGTGFEDISEGVNNPTPGPNTTSVSVTSDSDWAYTRFVGVDSSFDFRVRAETEYANSSWATTSSTAYTNPIEPHRPSVNRPDGKTFEITYTQKSAISQGVEIDIREDTGSGYGSWQRYDTISASESQIVSGSPGTQGETITLRYEVGTSYQAGIALQSDARYQWRIRERHFESGNHSDHVYTDYGNNGNLYFADGFESGDLSNWDVTDLSNDADSGVQSGSSHIVSGADEGTYYLHLDDTDYVQKNLGDLSGESEVVVRCSLAFDSIDPYHGDNPQIKWYDGSTWTTVYELNSDEGAAYNQHGWYQVMVRVPDSMLSTDNRIRFQMDSTGPGDHLAVDNVVVSDILHEYTSPAQPTLHDYTTPKTGVIEIEYTDHQSLANRSLELRSRLSGTTESVNKTDVPEQGTHTYQWSGEAWTDRNSAPVGHLLDGEQYEIRLTSVYSQDRHGQVNSWFTTSNTPVDVTTPMPHPRNLEIEGISGRHFNLAFEDRANNNTACRVHHTRPETDSYTQDGTDIEPQFAYEYVGENDNDHTLTDTEIAIPDQFTVLSLIWGLPDGPDDNLYGAGFLKRAKIRLGSGNTDNGYNDYAGILMRDENNNNIFSKTNSNINPLDGEPHTFALRVDNVNGEVSLWFDGQEIVSGTYSPANWGTRLFADNGWSTSYGHPHVAVSNTVLYDELLSSSQIQTYNDERRVPDGSKVLEWRYRQSSGMTVYDQTGNGNDGTVQLASEDDLYRRASDLPVRYQTTELLDGQQYTLRAEVSNSLRQGYDTVVPDNLVGYWSMDTADVDTGSILDHGLFNNDGAINGATPGADAPIGQGFEFDGTDDYVEMSFPNLSCDSITISLWVKPLTLSDTYEGIVGKDYNDDWAILTRNDSTTAACHWYTNAENGDYNRMTDIPLSTEEYTHVVVVYDHEEGRQASYANAQLHKENTSSFTAGASLNNSLNYFRLGERITNGEKFNGLISDVRIYNRALSETEIQTLYEYQYK